MTTAAINLFSSILPTLNSTFLIDTSGSMYTCLKTIREHLSHYLHVHAIDVPDQNRTVLFNLIEFNSTIRRWADRSVFWTHASVTIADDWLRSLEPKTGTNTLGGLLTAFADSLCRQVILITDGIPDQEPQSILNFLQHKDQIKQPCHVFYIRTPDTLETEQEAVVKFLQDLAALTRGSLTIVHFSRTGVLEGIAPMINYQIEDVTQTLLVGEAAIPPPECVPLETVISTESGSLLIGQECLARKDKDGYYYRGKILNQININQFTVEFGPRSNGGFSESDFQSTYLFDIMHYADALLHKIQTGDFVLAPEGHQGRFVPGEVLDGFERRASCEQGEIRHLLVHFVNGKTTTLKRLQEAVWIPPSVYERIKFELAMPSTARQYLQATSVAYPARVLPGYPNAATNPAFPTAWPCAGFTTQQTMTPIVLSPQQLVSASVDSHEINNVIMSSQQKPASLMTSDELNRKVDEQIRQHSLLLDAQSSTPVTQNHTTVYHVASMPPPVPHNNHHHRHHHQLHQHISHSASTSPSLTNTRKKNVSFDDRSLTRRHSIDDLDASRQGTPLRSCLKSSNSVQFESSTNDQGNYPRETQIIVHHPVARPHSASSRNEITRSTSVPNSVELWRGRQLKSAPIPGKKDGSNPRITTGHHRQNLGHFYEKAQAEVKEELYQQKFKREEFKRQQAQQQSVHIKQRQEMEAAKPEQILDAKRQYRSQVIHRDAQRTQSVDNQNNDRLRYKQQQYANRCFEREQIRSHDEQRNNAVNQRRQNDQAQRIQVQHRRVLAQESDRLYRDVIARKFHEETKRKYGFLQNRERRETDLLHGIEQRRIVWSNPDVHS